MFAEGVDEVCIDVVDGDPQRHNNHILGHSFSEGVSILYNHGHIGAGHTRVFKAEETERKYIVFLSW